MPIENYDGKTFVAFIDISGFKKLMLKEEGWKALDKFYNTGYNILQTLNQPDNPKIEGIFISDKGILFVRDNPNYPIADNLKSLLRVIKRINKKMTENDIMLTTSIAYGNFKYQERIEFSGIGKNPIYGNAYVSAYLDSKKETPKIQPGQCRIVKENLPDDVTRTIEQNQENDIIRMIQRRDSDKKHYYYYWMRNDPSEIDKFKQDYKDTYNLKYVGILKALKG